MGVPPCLVPDHSLCLIVQVFDESSVIFLASSVVIGVVSDFSYRAGLYPRLVPLPAPVTDGVNYLLHGLACALLPAS